MLSEAKVGGLVERQGRHKTVPDGSYIIISAYSFLLCFLRSVSETAACTMRKLGEDFFRCNLELLRSSGFKSLNFRNELMAIDKNWFKRETRKNEIFCDIIKINAAYRHVNEKIMLR